MVFRGRIGPGGPAGLQNRDGGAFGDSGGFDSHTLPPAQPGPGGFRDALALLAALICLAPAAVAQDTTAVAPGVVVLVDATPRVPVVDTTLYRRAPTSAMGAFARSIVLPGWGQALLGRRLTGGLFLAWEGVTLGMTIKSYREYSEMLRNDPDRAPGKRQEREDWLVLLLFNHLFAGLEAFVGTHLYDFPEDVRIRGIPGPDGIGVRVSVPIRLP